MTMLGKSYRSDFREKSFLGLTKQSFTLNGCNGLWMQLSHGLPCQPVKNTHKYITSKLTGHSHFSFIIFNHVRMVIWSETHFEMTGSYSRAYQRSWISRSVKRQLNFTPKWTDVRSVVWTSTQVIRIKLSTQLHIQLAEKKLKFYLF